MLGDGLEIIDGFAGAWIEPRLGGEFGVVTLQVPEGFEAYARVFHPASDSEGKSVSWAEVAKVCGTIPHREMQWHAILGLADADELGCSYTANDPTGVKWAGSDPMTGAMDVETLDALCEILALHTVDITHCLFGLCTIQSWEESFSAGELQPFLRLPLGRDHIVLAGSLSAVDQIVRDWSKLSSARMVFTATEEDGPSPQPDPSEFLLRESPNLIWPADHTWLVASEVDFDSTLVGGSAKLIEAIVESPELEAWRVEPSDSLASDADKVNVAGSGDLRRRSR
jgi:hypothetical protein